MIQPPKKMTGSKRSATGRYLTAALAALTVNIALMVLLSSNAARARDVVQPVPQAFPLEVLDMNAAVSKPVVHESLEPPPATKLPQELPLPTLAVQTPSLPEPVRLELAINASTHIALNTRDIAIPAAYEPQAPLIRPAARPKPVAPKPTGDTRGPIRIDPPNLSDYYPRRALRQGVTGVTTIKLVIDKTGRVGDITILSSTPAGVFENAARRHAHASKFQPGVRNGRPVSSVVRYSIKWELPARSRR